MRDQVQKLLEAAAARMLREHAPEALPLVAQLAVVPGKSPSTATSPRTRRWCWPSRCAARRARSRSCCRPRSSTRRACSSAPRSPGPASSTSTSRARAGTAWSRACCARARRSGAADAGQGEHVMVEFVSANPTGPLTIGHGRNAVLGDCIARLLEATGYKVTREYYFNDAGRQMRVLAQSLRARYLQLLGDAAELPEEGYQGEYLVEIARALVEQVGDGVARRAGGRRSAARAVEAIFADIEGTLAQSRRALRRLLQRAHAVRAQARRGDARRPARARADLRAGRRDLAALDRLRARARPRAGEVDRRGDLSAARRRLSPRDAAARLRPRDRRARARPHRAVPVRAGGDRRARLRRRAASSSSCTSG